MSPETFIELRQLVAAARQRHEQFGDFSDAELQALLLSNGADSEEVCDLMYRYNE